jgi:hypothetical protein
LSLVLLLLIVDIPYDKIIRTIDYDLLVFASKHSKPHIHFFRNKLNLIMYNDQMTPRSGTTIDPTFTRYLPNEKPKTYISYFSYPRPIISTFQKEISTDESSDKYMEIDELEYIYSNSLFLYIFLDKKLYKVLRMYTTPITIKCFRLTYLFSKNRRTFL